MWSGGMKTPQVLAAPIPPKKKKAGTLQATFMCENSRVLDQLWVRGMILLCFLCRNVQAGLTARAHELRGGGGRMTENPSGNLQLQLETLEPLSE